MPALWESSERPMFVRTVWVDGLRHAVLTKDDPLLQRARPRQRPASSGASAAGRPGSRFSSTRHARELHECFRKLRIVIHENVINSDGRDPSPASIETPVEKLDLDDIDSESEEELVLKASAQPLCKFDTSRSKIASLCVDMAPAKTTKPNPNDNKKYDLSERVLQWLDLAGKIDLLTPADNARIAQPRHSCPEIQKRLPFNKKPSERVAPMTETPFVESAAIDRPDIDPPSRVIESYARQSRHGREAARTGRTHPPHRNRATKTNDRPIGAVAAKTDSSLHEDANFETRQRVVAEIYDVERQFAELVNRGGLPDSCGRHIKRQVHIFMPPVPKKITAVASASAASSLLSQPSKA